MKFAYPEGATPIDPNEETDLIPSNIITQSQLNEVEYENIVRSRVWSRSRKHGNLLTVIFVVSLHKRMFGDDWKWAGKRRQKELHNEKFSHYYSIPTETDSALADFRHRLQHAAPKTGEEWNRLGA